MPQNIPDQLRVLSENLLNEYHAVIRASESRMIKKIEQLSKGLLDGDEAEIAKHYKRVLKQIQNEKKIIAAALADKEKRTIAKITALQTKWAKNLKTPFKLDTFANLSAISAKKEVGKLLGGEVDRLLKTMDDNLRASLKSFIAENAKTDGKILKDVFGTAYLEGSSIRDASKALATRVFGGGIVGSKDALQNRIDTVVRWNMARIDATAKLEYGKQDKDIVGVIILRGPGECPSGICGDSLGGIAEGEEGYFLYANGIPYPPFHPNCFCAIVGYIYADDDEYIKMAEKADKKSKKDPIFKAAKTGDYRKMDKARKEVSSNKKK